MLTPLIISIILAAPTAKPAEFPYAIQPILYTGKDGKFSKDYEASIKIHMNELNQFCRRTLGKTPIVLPFKRVISERINADLFSKQANWRTLIPVETKLKAKQLTLVFTSGGRYIDNFGKLDRDSKGLTIISERAIMDPNRPRMDNEKVGRFLGAIAEGMGIIRPPLEEAPTIMLMPGDYPEVSLMPHEVMTLKNSPWFALDLPSPLAPQVDPSDITDYVRPGSTINLPQQLVKAGDRVEFTGVRIDINGNLFNDKVTSIMTTVKVSPGKAQLTIPNEAPSGYIRFWRGSKAGISIPIFIAE